MPIFGKKSSWVLDCIASGGECGRRLQCMLLAKNNIHDLKGPSPYLADSITILITQVAKSVKFPWGPLIFRASRLISSRSFPVALASRVLQRKSAPLWLNYHRMNRKLSRPTLSRRDLGISVLRSDQNTGGLERSQIRLDRGPCLFPRVSASVQLMRLPQRFAQRII